MTVPTMHRRVNIDGTDVFYREAGATDAPAVLLPHGYPCSSYEFREFIPRLADRFRLVAPDLPGSGHTDTPRDFRHDFDGQARFLERFTERLGLGRYALYLHDFGGWIGMRLAMARPHRITALIIQNVDIYEDEMGPKYASLRDAWNLPEDDARQKILEVVTEDGYREEFLNDVRLELAERIPPDLWKLHWALTTPERRAMHADVILRLKENLDWFPRYQAYLRQHRPPTLILWGPQDGYMPEGAARAYLRDVPDAELHLLDGGHWLLETNLDECVALSRDFLTRELVLPVRSPETLDRRGPAPVSSGPWSSRTG